MVLDSIFIPFFHSLLCLVAFAQTPATGLLPPDRGRGQGARAGQKAPRSVRQGTDYTDATGVGTPIPMTAALNVDDERKCTTTHIPAAAGIRGRRESDVLWAQPKRGAP